MADDNKLYSQEEVDRIVKDRIERENKANDATKLAEENKRLAEEIEKFKQEDKSKSFDAFLANNNIKLEKDKLEEYRKTFDNDVSKLESALKLTGALKPEVKETNPFAKDETGSTTPDANKTPVTKDDPVVKSMLN